MRPFLKSRWPQLLALLAISAGAYHFGLALEVAGSILALGMAISFPSISNNLRVPFVAAEFDNSRAEQGAALLPYRALIIGQKTSAGTGSANGLHRVTSADDVLTLGGRGSMLHRMAMAWFHGNKATEVYIGVLEDNGAGTAAAGTVTITVTTAVAGTLRFYFGGVLVEVAVTAGMAQNSIATALAAAITANLDLPITASASANAVTVTFRHKGVVGNNYDMRLNYRDGDETPGGVSVVIVAMANGATNPTLTTLIANLADNWYHIIAHPYTDATSLTAIENEMASRFGPMRMIDGVAITAAQGSNGTLTTLGGTRNSPHSVIMQQPGENPLTPAMEAAAAIAAVVAFYANSDPARPLQTLPVTWMLAPAEADNFSLTERNLALYDGIGTTKVAAGGIVQLERVITTYQTNGAGAADTSYLDITTMLTILYLRYSFRNLVLLRYPRHKLASDGTRLGAGQAVITPKLMKAEAVAWFRQMENLGLVEGFAQFKNDLVVERNASDPNRLDVLLPPDLINQFVVGAVNLQFRL